MRDNFWDFYLFYHFKKSILNTLFEEHRIFKFIIVKKVVFTPFIEDTGMYNSANGYCKFFTQKQQQPHFNLIAVVFQ